MEIAVVNSPLRGNQQAISGDRPSTLLIDQICPWVDQNWFANVFLMRGEEMRTGVYVFPFLSPAEGKAESDVNFDLQVFLQRGIWDLYQVNRCFHHWVKSDL